MFEAWMWNSCYRWRTMFRYGYRGLEDISSVRVSFEHALIIPVLGTHVYSKHLPNVMREPKDFR